MRDFFSWLIVLLLLPCFAGCESEEHSSVARQVAPTYETEVIAHPKWTEDVVCAKTNWSELLTKGKESTFSQIWQATKSAGVDVVITDLPVKRKDGLLLTHQPTERYLPVSIDSLRSIVNVAKSKGIHLLFDWKLDDIPVNHPWIEKCPACFESKVIDDNREIFTPLALNSELHEIQKISMQQWIDSCGFEGYFASNSVQQPLIFWEQTLEALDPGQRLLTLSDNPDPAVHSAAFHASPNLEFQDVFLRETLRLTKMSVEELHEKESQKYLPNAYRSFQLTAVIDSVDAIELAPLRNAFAFMYKGLPIIDSLNWEIDTNQYPLVQFASGIDAAQIKQLASIRRNFTVLKNGLDGGEVRMIDTKTLALLAFTRQKNEEAILTIINYSDLPVRVEFSAPIKGEYLSLGEDKILFSEHTNGTLVIQPFSYWILEKQKPRFES